MEISHFSDDHGLKNGFLSANNMKRKSAQCGFSLIELIVVIAIMAVLVGLIAPQFVKQVQRKRCETCRHNREAILRVYERAVYDGSVPIYLKEGTKDATGDGILRVVDYYYADKDDSAYGIHNDISQYMSCPVNPSNTAPYEGHINEDTGAAYIYCKECAALVDSNHDYATAEVSIDLLGWANPSQPVGADPTRMAPPSPSPSPTAKPEEYTVEFKLNNSKASPQPAKQEGLKKGDKVAKPTDPKAPTYTFLGWFDDATAGNQYMFTEEVTSDLTLWAHWEGVNGGSKVWPYADDPSWWDASIIAQAPVFDENGNWIDGGHAGYYDPNMTKLNFDAQDDFASNAKVGIYTPSGIFTSRSGAQFVYVDTQDNGSAIQLELKYASSPEYYSARFPDRLVLLTGNKTVINITGKSNDSYFNHTNPGQYKIPLLTHGDLVEFIDDNKSYMYVYWEGQTKDRVISISEIRSYANHPNGLYKVNKTPTTITN